MFNYMYNYNVFEHFLGDFMSLTPEEADRRAKKAAKTKRTKEKAVADVKEQLIKKDKQLAAAKAELKAIKFFGNGNW